MSQQTPLNRVLFARRVAALLTGVFVVFVFASLVTLHNPVKSFAATDSTVNFQARLESITGAIVPDGTYNVEFKLYNTLSTGGTAQGVCSGNCQWMETRVGADKVTVTNGYLSVGLGSVTAFASTINWDQDLYITMNIGGTGSPAYDGEMTPRLKLTAVPYALRAGQLAQLNVSTGFTSTLSIVQPTGGNQIFQIPDQGAAGTYSLLTNTTGVQLQSSTPGTAQTGNFNITGTGIANTFNATTALQTGGVTRVDASGNLTNIGNIGGTGTLQLSGSSGSSYIMSALGLGTTSPQAGSALTIANGSWLSAVDSAGTGYINMFQVNANNEIQVGAALNIDGGIILPTDGGQMTFSDLPISTSATAGTPESYSMRVGSSNALTVYGEADGSGNAQNVRVAIGSSIAPAYTLDVGGDANITGSYRINGTAVCTSSGCTASSGSGSYIQNGTVVQASGNFYIRSAAIGSVGGIIEGASGQTADLLRLNTWNGTTSTVVASFSAAGVLTLPSNGLNVGAGQLQVTGGNVAISGNINSQTISATANFTGTVAAAGLITGTLGVNVPTGQTYKINNVDINTAGTLTNVAYENQGNTFTTGTNTFSAAGTALAVTNNATIGGTLGVTGTITGSSTLQGTRLISTVATGTAPLTVASTTVVTNLNADLLDGLSSASFAASTGSTGYIQNQNAGAQATSNFWMSGTGRADTSITTPLLDTATAVALNIGTTNATVINLNENTTVAAAKTLTVTSALTSLTGATTGDALNVSNSTSTGNIAVFKDNATAVFTIGDNGVTTLQNTADNTDAFTVRDMTGNRILKVDTIGDVNQLNTTNPSFAVDTSGWTARTGCTLTRITTEAFFGDASGQCANTATANAGMNFNKTLTASTQYTVSVYAKTASNFATFLMGYAPDGVTETTFVSSAQSVVTGGWTRYTYTFTTGAVSGTPYFFFKQSDAAARTWYIDAMRIETGANADSFKEGKIQLGGSITNALTLQNSVDSTTALSIQNAAGTNLFSVDTLNSRVGIGTAAPMAMFSVGSTSQFQVSTTGAVTAVGVNSGAGLLQGALGLTVTGATANINATGTAATNIGNATGTFALLSSGGLNVTTGGAVTGVSTLATSSTINSQTISATANFTGTVAAAGLITGTLGVNVPTGQTYKINNVDINTAGTLTNVAYENQGNTFTTGTNTFSAAGTALAVTNNATIGGTLGVTGAITGSSTITGTTLNGTTGINTGAGAGTLRLSAAGALSSITGYTQSSGSATFNQNAANQFKVVALQAPTTDMVNVSNAGFPITTDGISGQQVDYYSALSNAAYQSSAVRVNTTNTSAVAGSITNALRVVATGAVAGTTNGIKVDNFTSGAGGASALYLGTGWKDLLSYNGTQIISGTGLIQNAAIDPAVTYSNIQKVGALSTGSLAAGFTTVAATVGGTGQSSYVIGDLLFASSTTALSRLADVATGSCLISGGAGVAPSWGLCGAGGANVALSNLSGVAINTSLLPGVTNSIDLGSAGLTVRTGYFGTSVSAPILVSTVATGTAPLTVASTTVVTNLNADMLDGLHASSFATSTGSGSYIQNGTVVQASGNFYIRSAAIGSVGGIIEGASGQTADLLRLNTWNGTTSTVVASFSAAGVLTLPSNGLNVGAGQLQVTGGNVSISGNINSQTISATANFTGTVAAAGLITGTLGVNVPTGQTYKINNVDINTAGTLTNVAYENQGNTFTTGTNTFSAAGTALAVTNNATIGGTLGVTGTITGSSTLQGTRLISTVATGTAPLTVASTTVVTNLNADLLDGLSSASFAASTGSTGYIQNQNAGAQATSNFWMSGTGRADTSITTPLLDTATAVPLNIGTTNATVINLNENTTVAANKSFTANGDALFKDATNSATAFQVQNASSNGIFAIDTTNSLTVLGKAGASGIDGKLVFNNAAGANTVTIQAPGSNPVASFALILPTTAGAANECIKNTATPGTLTYGTCGGAVTMQGAYDGSGTTNPQIVLSSTKGGLKIQDGATPVTGNLFQIGPNGSTTTSYFGVSSSAVTLQDASGNNALVFDSTNSILKVYENGASPTNYASISYASGAAIFAASSGTTQVGAGSGGGNINLVLTGAADQLLVSKTNSLAAAYSVNDFKFTRNLTVNGFAATGNVMTVEDLTGGATSSPNVLYVNQNNSASTGNLILAQTGGGANDKFKVTTAGDATLAGGVTIGAGSSYSGVGAVTLQSGAATALTITSNAGSTWSTTAGALSITSADATTWSTTAGALNLTSAAAATWSTSAGALTLTSAAATTWSTTSGNLTIQAGGANTVILKVGTDSATAVQVQNSSGTSMLNFDSSADQISVGVSDTTGTLLVLDTKTDSGDPTGVNGAMYYNSDADAFRCYTNGLWKDCGTASLRSEWTLKEDWLQNTVATGTGSDLGNIGDNLWTFVSIGVGGTLTKTDVGVDASDQDRFGVLQMNSPATVTTGTSLRLDNSSMAGVPNNMTVEFDFAPVNTAAATQKQVTYRIGLLDSTTSAAPTNGIYFQYSKAATAGNWERCTANNTAITCTDTGIAATTTANEYQRLKFVTNSVGTQVDFYINEASAGSNTTNLPGAARSYGPTINMNTVNSTVRQFKMDYFQIKRNLTTLR